MPVLESALSPTTRRSSRSRDAQSVFVELERLHGAMQVGEAFPSYRELVEKLDASERAVRTALDELVRQGKLIRRQGAGTFVADAPHLNSTSDNASPVRVTKDGASVLSSTITAITKPDNGFFDHAIHLLHGCVEAKNLAFTCQIISATKGVASSLIARNEQPLGTIVFGRDLYSVAQELQMAGQRVVLVGTPPEQMPVAVPNVYGNHEQGGYQATKHLLQLGHRRLAFRGPDDLTSRMRWRGNERAIEEFRRRGAMVETSIIYDQQFNQWRAQPTLGKEYFAAPQAPTGIIMWNDGTAFEMLSFLNFIGVRVPQDVSLVGYDNLPASAKVFPALTTVENNLEQQLDVALSLLVSPTLPTHMPVVITVPTIINRNSTAEVAG